MNRPQVSRWVGFAGAAGALGSVLMLSGCPGTLDQSLFETGTGGSTATGGSGGSNPTGGATGTGGTSGNCTGGNDGATIVAKNCASSLCHDTADANTFGAGLDLTINSTIGSRLVDVKSTGDTNAGSVCGGNSEAYLNSGANPAAGLLIDKITANPPCGSRMPFTGVALSPMEQTCLIQWATTLTSP